MLKKTDNQPVDYQKVQIHPEASGTSRLWATTNHNLKGQTINKVFPDQSYNKGYLLLWVTRVPKRQRGEPHGRAPESHRRGKTSKFFKFHRCVTKAFHIQVHLASILWSGLKWQWSVTVLLTISPYTLTAKLFALDIKKFSLFFNAFCYLLNFL